MTILPFAPGRSADVPAPDVAALLDHFSIEVMPRTAAKIADFGALLPEGTRIYVAHIEGTPITDMIGTAKRLRREGFRVMPHFPARLISDRAELSDWIDRYRGEADVSEALVLAGGPRTPTGAFHSSVQLLETGLFEAAGFTRLHVAGHPEGNRDIDPDGGDRETMAALRWKQDYARETSADMAIVTQFAFEADGVLRWTDRLVEEGIALPVHLGVAGPTKLQTLVKFAIACGVGPSLSVLQKRARDVTRLLQPFTPDQLLSDLAAGLRSRGGTSIERIHIFPLGGIAASAEYAAQRQEEGSGVPKSDRSK